MGNSIIGAGRTPLSRLRIFAALCFLVSLTAPVDAGAAECRAPRGVLKTETTCGEVVVDGRVRTFRYWLPKYRSIVPLVIVLHGGGGSGAGREALARYRMTDLARDHRFAIVYPDAFEGHWNDGRKAAFSVAHRENIDDVAFIAALIDDLTARRPIFTDSVFVVGMSNGGMMALRLDCELADRVMVAVSVAGSLAPEVAKNCAPSAGLSVLMINGTADPLVPYEGGRLRTRPGDVAA